MLTHAIKPFDCVGAVIEDSLITATALLSFLESSGPVEIYKSSVSAIDLVMGYTSLRVVDSIFTLGVFLYDSGRLDFRGISFTPTSASSLVRFVDEPSSTTYVTIEEGQFSGSNLGIITTSNSAFATPFDLTLIKTKVSYSSVVSSSLAIPSLMQGKNSPSPL